MGTIPDWFWEAVETEREEGWVEVEDCDVRWQAWGEPGAPGLLLVHGMFAHAHWWDFVAPRLADRYRIAALDLTGMGDSDYRHEYDADTWTEELLAVAEAAGLGAEPVVAGHSFGGRIGLHAVAARPEHFGALVMLDSGVRDPDEENDRDRPPIGGRPVLYPDVETARARFRLQPPQPCENEYLVEYIARESVMAIDGGFAFKFDDELLDSVSGVSRDDAERDLAALTRPLGLLYGTESELFSGRTVEYMRRVRGEAFPAVGLDGARHHLFLDRPLEFTDALAAMVEGLRGRS